MTQAKQGDTVRVHYTGMLKDGTVFDSSADREPLQFAVGSGQVIAGFDRAVIGLDEGETTVTHIPPAEAYGPHRAELVTTIDRGRLPQNVNPAVGQRLQMRQADGRSMLVRVTGVSQDSITLDANHPLAGEEPTFSIRLVEIVS